MRRSSSGSSRRRITACDGDGTGSIWCGSPKRTGTNSTSIFRQPGRIATTWSARSTTTCPTTQFVTEHIAGDLLPLAAPQSARPHERIDRRHGVLVVRAGKTIACRHSGRAVRHRRQPDRRDGQNVPRIEHRLRPLPRPQVRRHPDAGLLRVGRLPAKLAAAVGISRRSAARRRSLPNWRRVVRTPLRRARRPRLLDPQRWSDGSPNRRNSASLAGVDRNWRPGAAFVARRQRTGRGVQTSRTTRPRTDEQENVVFEDFSNPFRRVASLRPRVWIRPSRAGDFVSGTRSSGRSSELPPPGAAHSGLISPQLRGALRSRTFTIDETLHPLSRRAAWCATDAAPRPSKPGQFNLIVDGFQIIRDPLYGHLSLTVANDAPAGWYTQDVSKLTASRPTSKSSTKTTAGLPSIRSSFRTIRVRPSIRPIDLVAEPARRPAIDSPRKAGGRLSEICSRRRSRSGRRDTGRRSVSRRSRVA